MILVLLLLFLVFLAAAIICPLLIFVNPLTSWLYRFVTAGTALVVATVTYRLTFYFIYFSNPNTRIHGWPVPVVIFQRDTPEGPWLDYVGPTVVLGFPINLVLLLGTCFFLLRILNIVLTRKKNPVMQPQIEAIRVTPNLMQSINEQQHD
jgi:hypothetical protein